MPSRQLTLEQRVEKSALRILAHPKWQAISGVLMFGKRDVSDDPSKTAYTNGRDVVFGREFCGALSDPELRFVDLHEQFHKMKRDLITWRKLWEIDPKCANMAADFVINLMLKEYDDGEGFIQMPEGGCYDPKYRNMTVAEVFRDLRKNPPPGGGGGGESGEGFDQHGWEEAQAMSAEEQEQIAREIDAAVRSGALAAGKMGTGGERMLGDLLEPQVPWEEHLREFALSMAKGGDMGTWQRLNRRYLGAGYIMPGTITEQMGEWVVAVDTSGSISQLILTKFMSEVVGLTRTVQPEKIHLLYWDTAVCAHEVYLPDDYPTMAETTKPAGGGGTLVECVPAYIAEKQLTPQGVIVLTDGYLGGSWGDWSCPVLWCVIDNRNATAPVGTTVHIDSETM